MMNFTKSPKTTLTLLILTLTLTLILILASTDATRADPKNSKPKGPAQKPQPNPVGDEPRPAFDQFWGPGVSGGGYGYGSPSGGHSKGEIIRRTLVCKNKGPCYMKKLRCPANCFMSFSRSSKGYGSGGGGGECIMDCTKRCTAYC